MNEQVIINEIQNGKQENFDIILDKYRNMIYKIINVFNLKRGEYIISEDDLFQEASMALYDACIHYRKDKGTLFSTFAYTIIKRRVLNKYRDYMYPYNHEIKSFDLHDYEYININQNVNDPSIIFYHEELKNQVYKYIDSLNIEDKRILNLRSNNATYNEIAERLNISRKRVDNRMCILRKRLNRDVLKREKF